MQEDLVVLLEWLNANGISDIFNEEINKTTTNTTEEEPMPKTLNNFVKALAEQQKEVRNLNPFFSRIGEVKKYADQLNSLDNIVNFIQHTDIYECFRKSATNTIIVNGNIQSNVLIINDLPSDIDDETGCIFGGDCGVLFENMMKSINVIKNDYCIINSFFWRLAGGRTPIKEELEICKPFVEKIISIINPQLIIFTGNYSISTIFENNKTLISVRGKFLDYSNCYMYNNVKITATYNPNFLLKNKNKKRDAWDDLVKIGEFLRGW